MLEDVLVRQDVPYQVIGGPRFYERAEIKDAIAYLTALDNLGKGAAGQAVQNMNLMVGFEQGTGLRC